VEPESCSDLPVLLQVSRPGLTPQAVDLKEVILKKWDKQSRLSRACLRRDLEALLSVSRENLDKAGQNTPPVTSLPLFITT
jgi:hypothetical protein